MKTSRFIKSMGVVAFLGLFFNAKSQVGISISYKTLEADSWSKAIEDRGLGNLNDWMGKDLGLNYWFRLKKKRVEFTPELGYGWSKKELISTMLTSGMLSLSLHTNFYPFDFNSDCDCPTWSKTGNFFTKGFYLQLSLGGTHFWNNLETGQSDIKSNPISWFSGIGAGLDFGISDLITLTPFVRYSLFPSVSWDGIVLANSGLTTGADEGTFRQFNAGLKLSMSLKKS